jgi:hypothetical protein
MVGQSEESNHEFFDLISDNDKHSLIGACAEGNCDERGFPVSLIRVVAVNDGQVQELIARTHVQVVGGADKGVALLTAPTKDRDRDLEWSYTESAMTIMPIGSHAEQLCYALLAAGHLKVNFPVAGCIVLIGREHLRRFWVGFDPPWTSANQQLPGRAMEIGELT